MTSKPRDFRAPIKRQDVFGPGFIVREIDVEQVGNTLTPFEMSLFTVEAGHSSIPEEHTDAEIWVLMRGQGKLTVGDQVIRVAAGDVVKLPSGVRHGILNDGNGPLLINSIWWL